MTAITLHPDIIFTLSGVNITNSLLTSLLVSLVLLIFSLFFYYSSEKNIIFKAAKIIIFELLKIVNRVIDNQKFAKKIFPLIATFFIFIVTGNLIALIPGFLGSIFINTVNGQIPLLRSPNNDVNSTLALAFFSVISIQTLSIKKLGLQKYITRFFNFSSLMAFVRGFLELLSELIGLFAFSFRLFGNIFASDVLLIITAMLTPYIIPVPFIIMDLFVGVIQAFIFAYLTLVFIKMSTTKHNELNNKKIINNAKI